MRRAVLLSLLIPCAAPAPRGAADTLAANGLRLVPVTDTGSAVTFAATAPGDPSRVFLVEQGDNSAKTAKIRVVRDGTLLGDPFLTVSNVSSGGETGLLSMAFAPDYATSGRFYVFSND